MRAIGKFPVVLVCLLFGSYFFISTSHSQAQAPTSSALLIDGGTLIDGTGKAPASGMSILVEGGRIRQIGKQGEVKAPAGGRTISASGKFIIPGLIDSHVHYNSNWLHKLYLAKGVTSVRDMVGPVERIVTLRDEIAAGNILGPRVFVSVNPGSWKSAGYSSAKEMTEKVVKKYQLDGIKVTGYTLEELKDIVQVAHANGLIVYGHTGPRMNGKGVGNTGWGSSVGALRAVEAGLDGVEHVIEFLEDCVDKDIPMPADFDPMRRDHNMIHYYGKLAKGRSTFVARRLIPYFHTLWTVPPGEETTRLSPAARAILKVLRREWEMATRDLQKASRIAERPIFLRAMDELQRSFKVIPADVMYKPTFTYIWTLAESRFQEGLAISVNREVSLREVARAFLAGAGMTVRGELAKVTGLSAPEAGVGNWALVDEGFAIRLAPGVYQLNRLNQTP